MVRSTAFARLLVEHNPNHDAGGRFATGSGGGAAPRSQLLTADGKLSPAYHAYMERNADRLQASMPQHEIKMARQRPALVTASQTVHTDIEAGLKALRAKPLPTRDALDRALEAHVMAKQAHEALQKTDSSDKGYAYGKYTLNRARQLTHEALQKTPESHPARPHLTRAWQAIKFEEDL